MRLARIRIQVDHSRLTIFTVLGALRQAVMRHSSEVSIPSAWACRIAARTVALQTPACPAIAPIVSMD